MVKVSEKITDLNIEAASDAAAMNAKKEMEELIAEIPENE